MHDRKLNERSGIVNAIRDLTPSNSARDLGCEYCDELSGWSDNYLVSMWRLAIQTGMNGVASLYMDEICRRVLAELQAD